MKGRNIAIAIIAALGLIWIGSKRVCIAYADMPCPTCGSVEVLDFGHTERGQLCHCFDCGQEFFIEDELY